MSVVGLDGGLVVGLDVELDVELDGGFDVGLDVELDVELDGGFDVGLDVALHAISVEDDVHVRSKPVIKLSCIFNLRFLWSYFQL